MGYHHFTPDYDLLQRRFVYRYAQPADPQRFPTRLRHGLRSDPTLALLAHPTLLRLELEHEYTSGHAWFTDGDRDLLLSSTAGVTPALTALIGDVTAARLQDLLHDPARWTPDTFLSLFSPGPAADGGGWELGRPRLGDGKLPNMTLRLCYNHFEVVLDRGSQWPSGARTREVLHSPASDADVVAVFGEEMLAVARLRARSA